MVDIYRQVDRDMTNNNGHEINLVFLLSLEFYGKLTYMGYSDCGTAVFVAWRAWRGHLMVSVFWVPG